MSGYLLPRHPAHHATESLLGYILRLSQENGYETPTSILSRARIRPANLRQSYKLTEVAKLTKCFPASMLSIAYHLHAKKRSQHCLLNHVVRQQDLSLTRPKLCPECAKEQGFLEAYFDLTVMIACPIHKKMLVEICPHCHQALRWRRPGLSECVCGAQLLRSSLPLAGTAVTDLLDVIRRKVLGLQSAIEYESGIPSHQLGSMKLRSILFLIGMLGRMESRRREQLTPDSCKRIVPIASAIFSDWPTNFERLLERLTASPTGSAPMKLTNGRLKKIYFSLQFGITPREDIAFMKHALSSFALNNNVDGGRGKEIGKSPNSKCAEQFLTLGKAAARCGIHPKTAARILKNENILSVDVQRGRGKRRYFDLAAIAALTRVGGKIYFLEGAASQIGVPASILRGLKASGDFQVNHLPKGMAGWHEVDIRAFILKLQSLAPLDAAVQVSSRSLLRFDWIASCRSVRVEVRVNFLRLVVRGEIEVVGRADSTLGGLLIPKSLFRAHVRDETIRAISTNVQEGRDAVSHPQNFRSSVETAMSLRCSHLSIPLLIGRGLLHGIRRGPAWWISEAAIAEFIRTYTFVTSVATAFNTTNRIIFQSCARQGISIVTLRLGKNRTQAFVRNADLSKISKFEAFLHRATLRRRARQRSAEVYA